MARGKEGKDVKDGKDGNPCYKDLVLSYKSRCTRLSKRTLKLKSCHILNTTLLISQNRPRYIIPKIYQEILQKNVYKSLLTLKI